MFPKKLFVLVPLGSLLLVATGCQSQPVSPVASSVQTQPAPVVQQQPAQEQNSAVPASTEKMTSYTGKTYSLSYPATWKYEFSKKYNADTFHGNQPDDMPSFNVSEPLDAADRGMCMQSLKDYSLSANGHIYTLSFSIPDTAGEICEDAFNYLKNPNFVSVFISNDMHKDITFTYAQGDTAAESQLKAILNSLKKK